MTELIAKNIRAQRLAQGMTQEELATKIFTTRQSISNYETGKSTPDYETIGKIATALGVNAEMLLYDMNNRRKKVRVWGMFATTGFLFALAYSLSLSPTLLNTHLPEYLTYMQGYITVLRPAVCTLLGWILVRLYELYVRKSGLSMKHARIFLILVALLFAAWLLAALLELPKFYEALSDTAKNQYGGPAKLSIYLETFYYKYIVRIMSRIPILNCFFVPLGGFTAVCANGECKIS